MANAAQPGISVGAERWNPHPTGDLRRRTCVQTISAGTRAPGFDLPDQDGRILELSTMLTRGPVALFFYPPAGAWGCVKEARHFRLRAVDFAHVGALRVGISVDDIAAQERFATSEGLDYPLLSDLHGQVAAAYGVRRKYLTPVKRATFVIDEDQQVADVFLSELNMTAHADRALKVLRRLVSA